MIRCILRPVPFAILSVAAITAQNACWAQSKDQPPRQPDPKAQPSAEQELDRGPIDKSTSVIGAEVVTGDGESLGTVTELLLDLQQGKARAAIIERNGSKKLTALPWPTLMRSEKGGYKCQLTAARFAKLADLDPESWGKKATRHWMKELYDQLELKDATSTPQPKEGLLTRASELRNRRVTNLKDVELGLVAGFAIATQDAQLVYVALSHTGKQPGLQAIPLAAFIIRPERRDWQLDISPEALAERPLFHDPAWPQTIDRGWAEYVHVLYGTAVFEGVRSAPKETAPKGAK